MGDAVARRGVLPDGSWAWSDIPKEHFAKLRKDLLEVVLVCDRYSAYKSLALDCDELILAFCWAHVRRDFLKAARSWPELERWMSTWSMISASFTPSIDASSGVG